MLEVRGADAALQRARRHGACGRGRLLRARGRRGARPRRRIGLGQDDDRPGDSAPHRSDRGAHHLSRRGHHEAAGQGAEALPPPGAADLPGPVRLAQPAHDGRGDHRGTARRARHRQEPRGAAPARRSRFSSRSACRAMPSRATRINSRAASASASRSRVRSPPSPRSSSPTSRSRRSTCRSRRRSSIFCASFSNGSSSPCSSSPMTSRSSNTSRTASIVLYLGRVMEVGPARSLIGAPKHPYTEALISAVPEPEPDRATRAHRAARRFAEPDRSALGLRLPHPLPLRDPRLRRATYRRCARSAPATRRPAFGTIFCESVEDGK